MGNSIFEEYISGKLCAGFFEGSFVEFSSFESVRNGLAKRGFPSKVIEILRNQNKRSSNNLAVQKNLELIAKEECLAVVTGQQAGIFLGPVFTFYKILSTIKLARELAIKLQTPCVPIFWLQSEDHDLEEISSINILGRDGNPIKIEVNNSDDSRNDKISVKYQLLGDSVNSSLLKIKEELGEGGIFEVIKNNYLKGESFTDAFKKTLQDLFGEDGLLIFDPRDKEVSKIASPTFEFLLTNHSRVSELLVERRKQIENNGFSEQVHTRDDSPLFFYHPEGENSSRYRLLNGDTHWISLGADIKVEKQELAKILRDSPDKFSNSALSRPLFQDSIFPTVAYVAGPSEVNYASQLGLLYKEMKIIQPVIVPRASFRLIDDKSKSIIKRLSISDVSHIHSAESLLKEALGKVGTHISPDEFKEQILDRIQVGLSSVKEKALALDSMLKRSFEKTEVGIERNVKKLVNKYTQSVLRKDEVLKERLEKLKNSLFPNNISQGRFYSFIGYASKFGLEYFKDKIYASIDCFKYTNKDVEL